MSHLRGSQAKLLCIASMLLFGALIASVVPSSPALACTPTATPSGFAGFTIADYTDSAEIIIEGTITTVTTYWDGTTPNPRGRLDSDEATIQVEQYLKGNGTTPINIRGFGPGAACLIEAVVGAHRIFYAFSDEQGFFWILAVANPNRDTIAQIQDVAGQLPVTPFNQITPSPDSIQTTPSPDSTTEPSLLISYILGILGIPFLVILAYFARKLKPQ